MRRRIGYVFGGEKGLYERLSALDNLRYFAELYSVPPRQQRQRIADLLELVGLTGRENERVEGYSRGMRQRLHIARGLIHDPEVVFLDEPTIGVDPVGARELRATIASLVAQGKTVLLTTHYMFEADSLCDRIAVIAHGSIVAEGTPEQLKAQVADRTVVEIEAFDLAEDGIARVRGVAGRRVGLGRGARRAPRAARPVAARARADAGAPRRARRDVGRPRRRARADARGRLRRARRRGRGRAMTAARVVWGGLRFHVKTLTLSNFFLLTTFLLPAIFASIAFFLVEAGRPAGDAPLHRARRRDDGRLVVDALRLRRGDPVAALPGHARAARRHALAVPARALADHARVGDGRRSTRSR